MSPRIYPPRRPHVGYREDESVLAEIDRQVGEGLYADRSEAIRAATTKMFSRKPQN